MLAKFLLASMFLGVIIFLMVARNGKKVKQKNRRYTVIAIFRNGVYYDLSMDERFTSLGSFEKYGDASFLCKSKMDDYQLRDFIIETLNIERKDINITMKRW